MNQLQLKFGEKILKTKMGGSKQVHPLSEPGVGSAYLRFHEFRIVT